MEAFWLDYLINDFENMEYRIEDIILHSMTGIIAGLVIHIKNIWKKIKSIFR